jgi:hypothetical protein
MYEENEGQEQETETSASAESHSEESGEGQSGEGQQAAPKQEQPEPTPFHEHPRFKELVEQKNQAIAAQKAMEQKLSQLEQNFQSRKAPEAPSKEQTELQSLIDDLKKVDPRLAAQIESAHKASSQVQQLQEKLAQFEQSQVQEARSREVQQAVSRINQMHETNKVSPELKTFINDKLDLMYAHGKLNSQNLDTAYKEVYDGFKKFEDSLRRSERESYVKSKTADSKIPSSQPKGTPAKPASKKPAFSTDPEVAKQQIVSRYLKAKAAEKDSSPV